jgi:hypothetical protein
VLARCNAIHHNCFDNKVHIDRFKPQGLILTGIETEKRFFGSVFFGVHLEI